MSDLKAIAVIAAAVMTVHILTLRRADDIARDAEERSAVIRSAPEDAIVDLRGMAARGGPDAAIVIVEFSDYECEFCARHAGSVYGELQAAYVNTGLVRYVFANTPLASHSSARLLATAGLCASRQDRFWPFHDIVFERQPRTVEAVRASGAAAGVDEGTFADCLADGDGVLDQLAAEGRIAQALGLTGTPSFALGTPIESDRVRVHTLIVGAQSLQIFEEVIKTLR